jgi:hypothetical protein
MALFVLKNLTNSPQMVGPYCVGARATSEPLELDDRMILAVRACGIFTVADGGAPQDAFDAMSDDELRELYEVVAGKKPHHKLGRDKLLETVRADG